MLHYLKQLVSSSPAFESMPTDTLRSLKGQHLEILRSLEDKLSTLSIEERKHRDTAEWLKDKPQYQGYKNDLIRMAKDEHHKSLKLLTAIEQTEATLHKIEMALYQHHLREIENA